MSRTLRGIAGVLLMALGAVVLAVLVVPRLFGWSAYVVTSGSMLPTFGPGSVVVTAPVDPDALTKDDIVTFVDGSGGLTTHRVAGVEVSCAGGESVTSILTKGDANEEVDPMPLDARNVVGRAEFAVPHLGYLVSWIRTPLGAGAIAALLLFVVFAGGRRVDATDETTDPDQARAPEKVAP